MSSLGKVSPYAWPDWHRQLAIYERAKPGRALWQLVHTVAGYLVLWYAMAASVRLGHPAVVVLALSVPAAGFLLRFFILFHDCAHGSLFASKRANAVAGHLCGTLVFTSLEDWRRTHLLHHGTYANLDARGVGDVWTMTRGEYEASSRGRRLAYRLYRNPFVLFGAGPLYYFLLRQRLPSRGAGRRQRMSVLLTDFAVAPLTVAGCWHFGWKTYALVQLPVLWLAGAAGIWLFYVQHQFEGVYWARREQWDPLRAAFDGSSFYRLPAVLRWFSGSIGFHFLHHLRPRIPNFNLKPCYDAVPELRAKEPLTLRKSLASARLKLWDEEAGQLIGLPL